MDLRKLVRDPKRMREGEWIPLGPEWFDLEVCVKALGHEYNDRLNHRNRALARAFNGREIPSSEASNSVVETLIECALTGVRAPTPDPEKKEKAEPLTIDGKPLDLVSFCELLRDPGSAELVNAVIMATSRVGRNAQQDREDAKGN